MANKFSLYQQYMRERKRIQAYIRKYKKQGISFDYKLPKIPKKITEGSVRRLRKTTAKDLQRKAYITTPETGEVVTGRKAIMTAKHARQAEIVLNNIEELISTWTPQVNWSDQLKTIKEQDKNRIENVLKGAIVRDGREAVAKRLEAMANTVNELVLDILYGSGSKEHNFSTGRSQVNMDLVRLNTIINGRSLTPEEAIFVSQQADEYNFF